MIKNIFLLIYPSLGLPTKQDIEKPVHYKKNGIIVQNISDGYVSFYDDLIDQEIFYRIEAPTLDNLPEEPICDDVASIHTNDTLVRAQYKQFLFDEIQRLYGKSQGTRHLTRRSADMIEPFEIITTQAELSSDDQTTKANVVLTNQTTTRLAVTQQKENTSQIAEAELFPNAIDYMKDRFRMSSTKKRYTIELQEGDKEYIMMFKPVPEYLCQNDHLYFELRIRTLKPIHKIRILLSERIDSTLSPRIVVYSGPDQIAKWNENAKDVKFIHSCEGEKFDNVNSTISIVCPNNDKQVPQEIKMGVNFGNVSDCTKMKIYQIRFELHDNPVESKERNRRQALMLGGLLASGLVGAFGTHFIENQVNSKKYDELEIMMENEDLKLKDVSGMVHALNKETSLLQKEYIESLCTTNLEERKLTLKVLAQNVANLFIDHVNLILFGSELPNSKVKQLASGICRNLNKGSNAADDCLKFYEVPEFKPQITNYGTVSEKHFKSNLGENYVWIKTKFQVPQLSRHEASLHRITSIPVPLGMENGEYKYKRYEVPSEMAYVSRAARKISLKGCKSKIFDTVFCSLQNFNEISNRENICLNSIFASDPQCYESTIYSASNCLFRKLDQTVYISHQGPSASLNNPKIFSKNSVFFNNGKNKIQGTGIYSYNFSNPVSISCQNTEFHFAPNYDYNHSLIDFDETDKPLPEFLLQDISLLNKQLVDLSQNKHKMSGFLNKYLSAEKNYTHQNFWTPKTTHLSIGLASLMLFNTIVCLYFCGDCIYWKFKYCCRRGKIFPGNGQQPIKAPTVKYKNNMPDKVLELQE